MVDHLAELAAQAWLSVDASTHAWLQLLEDKRFCTGLDWCWLLFDTQYANLWNGLSLHFPDAAPREVPDVLRVPFEAPADQPAALCCLRFCTYNVLTAQGEQDSALDLCGPSKLSLLLQQFGALKLHVFALQETRLRRPKITDLDGYWLFHSPADARGHFGVTVGISKSLPFQLNGGTFQRSDVRFVFTSPRALILHVHSGQLDFILLALHAPHSGASLDEISNWWNSITEAIPARLADRPKVLLADANAVVGSSTSEHVGAHQASQEEIKSGPFLDFLAQHDLFLPATFAHWQLGAGHSWTHSTGKPRRIDFIGLPLAWPSCHGSTWIQDDFETGFCHDDHLPACAEVSFLGSAGVSSSHQVRRPSKAAMLSAIEPSDFQSFATTPWETDVHTHADSLQQQILGQLSAVTTRPVQRPRKQTITEPTWQLVQTKRRWRHSLRELHSQYKLSLLRACFGAWSAPTDNNLAILDKEIAITLYGFRQLGRQVTAALRRDDRAFFDGLLTEAADFLQPSDVKQFWRVVQRALPKMQNRRQAINPLQIEALAPQWDDYFCHLEAGTCLSPADLTQICCSRQASQAAPMDIDLAVLPSLSCWEDALRETQPDRATGWDLVPSALFRRCTPELAATSFSLFLKMLIQGQEPIQYKGGPMTLIHKSGSTQMIQNFRGILLLPSLAKRMHAVLRRQLLPHLHQRRPEGQIGGFPHQQVAFGSQTTRTASLLFDARGWSNFTVFLDLRNAFHRLTRELVFGTQSQADFDFVINALQNTDAALSDTAIQLGHLGLLAQYGCPPYLLKILRDVHAETWCTLAQGVILKTRRGTRPGSPLADLVFHGLMQYLATKIQQWVADSTTFGQLLCDLDLALPLVIWSDDLALTWAVPRAEDLLAELDLVVGFLTETFQHCGFDLNFAKGKTNVVVSFTGPGASSLRKEWLLGSCSVRQVVLPSGQRLSIPLVLQYKHLGTMFTASHSLDLEISTRIGTACAAFAKISRTLVCNRRLPQQTRLRLFHSLIASKLFFGLGAWHTPPLRILKKLEAAYVRMLKRVLKIPHDDHQLSNHEVFSRAEALDVRSRLALDRLLYARKVFQVGPTMLQELVHLDFACNEHSWLHGVIADLQWFDFLLPNVLPPGFDNDLTALIDWWQDPATPWKRFLKRARRRHLLQEAMMADVHYLHRQCFAVLRQAGATFSPDPRDFVAGEFDFECTRCPRTFSSAQGLAAHKRLTHGIHAAEFPYVTGATCPSCLRYLWTSNRLALHLAYQPRDGRGNRCFAELQERGWSPAGNEHFPALCPTAVQGANRKDALQAFGPLPQRLTQVDRRLQALFSEQADCLEAFGRFCHAPS